MKFKFIIILILCFSHWVSNNLSKHFDIPVSSFDQLKLLFEDRYPVEEHRITTKDGYIITVHRIRPLYNTNCTNSVKKSPIYLHHALALDSSTWMWSLTNNVPLPFVLSDAGFDVWLGNSRGNYHSRDHIHLNYKTSEAYWNYTWHEIGVYDLPAVVDYMLEITESEKIHYIGHSQGTAAFFVMATVLPEYNNRILSFHAITPPVYMENISSPYASFLANKYGQPSREYYEYSKKPPAIVLIGAGRFLTNLCGQFPQAKLCTTLYAHIFGSNGSQVDEATAIQVFRNSPQGASLKCVIHFFQIIRSGKFRQYDYGEKMNRQVYKGMAEPPEYDVKKITCPVFLYYSEFDLFNSFAGNARLSHALRPEVLHLNYTVPRRYEFNHLDFIHGKSANRLIFKKILNGLNAIEQNTKNCARL